MPTAEVSERFAQSPGVLATEEYNFERFRTHHFAEDVANTIRGRGLRPGETAPNFRLPEVGGGVRALSDLRRAPILLHFGSFT